MRTSAALILLMWCLTACYRSTGAPPPAASATQQPAPKKMRPTDQDADRDGIEAIDDLCVDLAEDKDGFDDEDGCPDPDNDRDTMLDVDDQCPNDMENWNGRDDEDGCPDRTGTFAVP